MRSLAILLSGVLITIGAKMSIKDAIYQIQGVEVGDSFNFASDAADVRRKRQATGISTPVPLDDLQTPDATRKFKNRKASTSGAAAASNATHTRHSRTFFGLPSIPDLLSQLLPQPAVQPQQPWVQPQVQQPWVQSQPQPQQQWVQPQPQQQWAQPQPQQQWAQPQPQQQWAQPQPQQQWAQPQPQPQQQFVQQPPLDRLPSNDFSSASNQQQPLSGQLPQLQAQPQQPPAAIPRTLVRPGKKGTQYHYPQRRPLPLPKCFHNPTGYVCCNEELNDLMVETYRTLEQRPKFHNCNMQLIATHLQLNAQRHFNTSFETVVGYEDFAQKIHFRGDMVCKVEMGSSYMLAYATTTDAYNHDLGGNRREKREADVQFEWSSGTAESWHSIHSTVF